jgi:hypothetical protein
MSRILSSISGKNLGLDHNKALLCPRGIVSGNHGNQFHAPGPNKVVLFDDFTEETLAAGLLDKWLFTEGTDSATSAAAILAGGIGGVLRLTTGDAGTGLAADTEQMTANALQWQASNGGLVFQTRIKLSAITECFVFLGFTDTVAAALEAPIMSAGSANTITTNASDAVGFFFDTRMTADTWWTAGVKADVDATHYNTTYAPVAAAYETFRIEVSSTGVATFFRNGIQVGTSMANAITAATDLTPVITVSKTATAASMTLDVDYIHVAMDRGTYGASF